MALPSIPPTTMDALVKGEAHVTRAFVFRSRGGSRTRDTSRIATQKLMHRLVPVPFEAIARELVQGAIKRNELPESGTHARVHLVPLRPIRDWDMVEGIPAKLEAQQHKQITHALGQANDIDRLQVRHRTFKTCVVRGRFAVWVESSEKSRLYVTQVVRSIFRVSLEVCRKVDFASMAMASSTAGCVMRDSSTDLMKK